MGYYPEVQRWKDTAQLLRDRAERAEAERDRAEDRADRLEGKCFAVAQAIGLPPGGGDDGYLIPNVERVVAERDEAIRWLSLVVNGPSWTSPQAAAHRAASREFLARVSEGGGADA